MNTHHIISKSAATLSLCIAIGCESSEADVLVDELHANDSSSSDDGSDPETPLDIEETTGDPPTEPRLPATSTGGAADESSSTGASDADTSPDDSPEPWCGDGEVDLDEDCDDGEANAPSGACLPDCTRAFCGDGEIQLGVEVCDDGIAGNELEVGACAPNCSRVIEQKIITVADLTVTGGDLGPQPVTFADAHCEPGSLAMFAYPGVRHATSIPLHAAGSLDWVIQPFTAYANADGELLWITGPVPLLGVRFDQQHPLHAAVADPNTTTAAAKLPVITGLADGWITSTDNACAGWQSNAAGYQARVGRADTHDALLDSGTLSGCDRRFSVYCVEQ